MGYQQQGFMQLQYRLSLQALHFVTGLSALSGILWAVDFY
jgi:hypothetical protein